MYNVYTCFTTTVISKFSVRVIRDSDREIEIFGTFDIKQKFKLQLDTILNTPEFIFDRRNYLMNTKSIYANCMLQIFGYNSLYYKLYDTITIDINSILFRLTRGNT